MINYKVEILILNNPFTEISFSSELNKSDVEKLLIASIASHIFVTRKVDGLDEFISTVIENTEAIFNSMKSNITDDVMNESKQIVSINFL